MILQYLGQMRKVILFVLLLVNSLAAQVTHTPELDGLKGPAKQIQMDDAVGTLLASYDSTGKATFRQEASLWCVGADLEMSNDQWVYTYDSAGHVVYAVNDFSYMIQALEPDESGDKAREYSFTWDKNGRLIRAFDRCWDPKEDFGGTTMYEYDRKGNCILESHYSGGMETGDSLEKKIVRHYNRRNLLVAQEEVVYQWDTSYVSERLIYEYDRKKRLVKMSEVDGAGNVLSYTAYVLDRSGRRTEEMNYWDHGKTLKYRRTSVYSDTGSVHEYYSYYDGKVSSHNSTEYDLGGRKVRETYFKPDASIEVVYTYSYVTDDYGNWIVATRVNNDGDVCMDTRIITYW